MIKVMVLTAIISAVISSTDVISLISVSVTGALGLAGVIYTQRSTRILQEKQAEQKKEVEKKERVAERSLTEAERARTNSASLNEQLLLSENRRLHAENRNLQLERYIRSNELTVPPEDVN